jgi:hypothetical protein
MSDTQGAAAPTTEQAPATVPSGTEPATPATTSTPEGAAAENAETLETEQPVPEGEATDEPVRLNRTQRLQRKAARLATMVADQAAELEKLRQQTAKSAADSEPKEAEYNGDWGKYQADYAAWKATQNIRGVLDERDQQTRNSQIQERVREATEDFLERATATKKLIPDYDAVVTAFANQGGQFAPHVIEEVRDSDKGPELAYHIAKTPGLAAELNALSPRDAAREIGRIEAKLSLPQPKKQTQAPAPLTALKGGASPRKELADLAKGEDITEFAKAETARKKAASGA